MLIALVSVAVNTHLDARTESPPPPTHTQWEEVGVKTERAWWGPWALAHLLGVLGEPWFP